MKIAWQIKRFFEKLNEQDWSGIEATKGMKRDCLMCRILYNIPFDEYLVMDFWRFNRRERKRFMTFSDSMRIYDKVWKEATEEERRIASEKHLFNEAFKGLVNRDFIHNTEASEQEIADFLEKHGEVIVKRTAGKGGYGIKLVKFDENAPHEQAAELRCGGDLIIEEKIVQHAAIAKLNPNSVNTVRISTIVDKNTREVHFIAAALRVGGGKAPVDNFHSGGVAYPIDLDMGIVCGPGRARRSTANHYFHPTTGEQVIGMKIPNWDILLASVKDAAARFDKLRYVGWDVAITETGIELIEGNIAQGVDVMQLNGRSVKNRVMPYV